MKAEAMQKSELKVMVVERIKVLNGDASLGKWKNLIRG